MKYPSDIHELRNMFTEGSDIHSASNMAFEMALRKANESWKIDMDNGMADENCWNDLSCTYEDQVVDFAHGYISCWLELKNNNEASPEILQIGVGDGSGQHFVHGDYDSVKLLQSKLFELEELRKTNAIQK